MLIVQCGCLEFGGGSLFSDLSFGFVRFVSMSQSDRLELFFSFVEFVFRRGCWSLLYHCANFGLIFFLI